MSIKGFVGEIPDAHARLLVIEVIHAHVLFLNFDCSVVERVGAVLTSSDGNHHFGRDYLPIDAPCALGCNSEINNSKT